MALLRGLLHDDDGLALRPPTRFQVTNLILMDASKYDWP
jgi:hypothetical protein